MIIPDGSDEHITIARSREHNLIENSDKPIGLQVQNRDVFR